MQSFFYLRKAFDSVPHRSLLEKLQSSGIDCYILKWLFSYLHNREQYVVLNEKRSPPNRVTSGVPQGSVLGPLLFLIYINDSAGEMLSTGSSITMYADDLLLHRVISSSDDYEFLQNDINTLAKWVDRNHLTLNAGKCKCMVISRLRRRSIPFHPLKLHMQTMERVSQYKYLGDQ